MDSFYQDIIKEELNVKEVSFTDDVRAFTTYTFKPQLRTVGPKYGKQLGGIQKELAALDGNAAMDELDAKGALKFDIGGVDVELSKDDLLIEMIQKEGYISEADNAVTVVLDTRLTEELIEEGFVYEVISKIQTMRKEADYEVMDHIEVAVDKNEKIAGIIAKNQAMIAGKVLADRMTAGTVESSAEGEWSIKEWNVNGEEVTIGIRKV